MIFSSCTRAELFASILPSQPIESISEYSLINFLRIYQNTLARQRYIVGDDIMLAGLSHLPNGAAMKIIEWNCMFVKYPKRRLVVSRTRSKEILGKVFRSDSTMRWGIIHNSVCSATLPQLLSYIRLTHSCLN